MPTPFVWPRDLVERPIWDTGDLERLFPYSAQQIRELAKAGKFPAFFKINGKLCWNAAAVIAFAEDAASKTEAQIAA